MKLCGFEVGIESPLFLIAGPCVIESETMAIETAGYLKEICEQLKLSFIYKSSFDKANRSSLTSYRGPGFEKGLMILEKVKKQVGVPILTDVWQASSNGKGSNQEAHQTPRKTKISAGLNLLPTFEEAIGTRS